MLDPVSQLTSPSDRRYEHGYATGFETGKVEGTRTALLTMGAQVEENNRLHGWYDDERSFAEDIALLHSEVSEALDAWREIGFDERTSEGGKPDDVASELADVLIRLLDICQRRGIDLRAEYERKMRFNLSRPYRHGGKRL
jgi:NTP pyrophosphatase (non-canonical NTP hydrolase)